MQKRQGIFTADENAARPRKGIVHPVMCITNKMANLAHFLTTTIDPVWFFEVTLREVSRNAVIHSSSNDMSASVPGRSSHCRWHPRAASICNPWHAHHYPHFRGIPKLDMPAALEELQENCSPTGATSLCQPTWQQWAKQGAK